MEEASHPSQPSRPSQSSREVAASAVEQLAQNGSEDIGAIRNAVNDWLASLEGDATWFKGFHYIRCLIMIGTLHVFWILALRCFNWGWLMFLAYGFHWMTTFDYVHDFCVAAWTNISAKPMIKSSYQVNKITFNLIPHILISLAIFIGGLKNMTPWEVFQKVMGLLCK